MKKKLDHLNKVKVIKNALDERLWFNKIYKFQIKAKTVNIGYMGSVTHDTDLNLVKGAIKNLKKEFAENGIELNFYVIGGMNKKRMKSGLKELKFHQIKRIILNLSNGSKKLLTGILQLHP